MFLEVSSVRISKSKYIFSQVTKKGGAMKSKTEVKIF